MRTPGPEVVGREREFGAIGAFLAGRSERSALILEGEAGLGKTTLWRAAVARARDAGLRVLACNPVSRETQLSFAALADLLGGQMGEVAADLPAPQLAALSAALLLDDSSGEPAEPRSVYAATLSTLRALAARQPVLLAIDDVGWLDQASDEALAFAARRLADSRVRVLVARRIESRPGERTAFEDALEHGEWAVQRARLAPLDANAIHVVLRTGIGVTLPHRIVEQLHAASGGNPFFALELARAAQAAATGHGAAAGQGVAALPGTQLPMPATLQAAVRAHLEGLSPPALSVLAVVAALAEPTLPAIELAGAGTGLEEAVRGGVLEQDAAGRLWFSHPLLAAAAYGRLLPAERRALHSSLADVVDGEERARHLALGTANPSAEVADTLEEAARHASARGAIGAAADLVGEAIRLTPPQLVDVLHARQLAAAAYEVRHGDTGRARARLEPLVPELDPGSIRAGVLLQLARLREGEPVAALELCRQAIEEAPPVDVLAAQAHQLAAEMSMLSGDIPAAIQHARRACAVAEAAGERAVLIECLGTLCHYQTYTGAIEPGLLERAVALERDQPRPSNNYSPRQILGLRLLYADRLDEARELLAASYATAVEVGDELDRGSLLIHLTQLECRAGRLAVADRHAREVTISREQAGWGIAGARFATAIVGAHLGRVEQTRADAEEGAALAAKGGNAVFHVLNRWAAGLLELSLGDGAAADRQLRGLPEAVDEMGYWNPGVRPVHADAIEARLAVGDVSVLPRIGDLERRARTLDIASSVAAARRCRGLLLGVMGDLDAAASELAGAVEDGKLAPQPLERGRTLLALGSTLRRAKRRREAREVLVAALELFDQLGAARWAEKAASEIARISGRTSAGGAAGELTETERRVAALVADGLTNKEVAARLFVTVRTVESNLTSVYTKLGVRSRTELARRLVDDRRA